MDLDALSPHVRWVKRQTTGFLADGYVDYDHVFTYVAEGAAAFTVEGFRHLLVAGDAIVLPPFAGHLLKPVGGAPFVEYVIHFDPVHDARRNGLTAIGLDHYPLMQSGRMEENGCRVGDPEDIRHVGDPKEVCRAADPADVRVFRMPKPLQPALEVRLRSMLHLFEGGERLRALFLKAAMTELLAYCLTHGETSDERSPERTRGWQTLMRALEHIRSRYPDPLLDNARVAAQAGVTPNHLSAVFRERLGMTLHRYLTQVRIEQAKRLLASGSATITETAERTGFSGIHAFCRAFRRETGQTPGQYASDAVKPARPVLDGLP